MITLLFLINLFRTIPLTESAILNTRAEIRAEQLCEDNQWSHDNYRQSFDGIAWDYAGENLAKGFNNDIEIFVALMNSETHKANMLNQNYTKIGIGRACGITVQLFSN